MGSATGAEPRVLKAAPPCASGAKGMLPAFGDAGAHLMMGRTWRFDPQRHMATELLFRGGWPGANEAQTHNHGL
jgi:hypothetical protein